MSTQKSNNSSTSLKVLNQKIDEFRTKRDELNKKTKEYINQLQSIEAEINEGLKYANYYKKRRDRWNQKVAQLKDKKIEYKKLLDDLIKEKREFSQAKSKGGSAKRYSSIKGIDRKIEGLERKIETDNLELNEENAIIDTIKELVEEKQKILGEQERDDYYKIERKIEIVKINLNKIYEQLNKWSNKSQDNHTKMLEYYNQINDLKDQKSKMELELIENKKKADSFHEKFLEVMNKKKKATKGRGGGRSNRSRGRRKPRGKQSYSRGRKENEMLEKIKEDKLATALEKQKAGKKLNLFEARLILEKGK